METTEINQKSGTTPPPVRPFRYFPFFNTRQAIFVLVLIGSLFYYSSLDNEYALDDGIVIHQNSHVLKGVAGIGDILGKDLYHSFYEHMNASDQLQGGRYHPISVISFALEQELISTYRSGYYMWTADLNQNGVLDNEKVVYTRPAGNFDHPKPRRAENYEYNDYVDRNGDHQAQPEECYNCWDLNQNFKNEPEEDLNQDGVFNEVDCQVKGAGLRHFNNVWLYVLASVLLYLVFSRCFFKDQQDIAFLAALLFLVHPAHSEIVACVRGRGEIFALLFMALCFLFSFRFLESKNTGYLLLASLMLWLALLSKEFAIILLPLVPLAFHVFVKLRLDFPRLLLSALLFLSIAALMIFLKLKWLPDAPAVLFIGPGAILFGLASILFFRKDLGEKNTNALMIGFYTLTLLYFGMRINAVRIAPGIPDTELLNDPYLLANGAEKFATKVFVLLRYLGTGIFPNTLCSDYSYNTIPYQQLSSPGFIVSAALNLALIVTGVVLCVRRHPVGFAIAAWYLFLSLVGNFFFAIGTTQRDAYLFNASIGFAMALAWLAIKGLDRLQNISLSGRRSLLLGVTLLLTVLCGFKTSERNRDWKNDVTLFLKDVKTNPNSVLILGNAGARWIDLADTKEITGILLPGEDSTRYNDYNGTLHISDEDVLAGGYSDKREAALQRGIGYLEKAVSLHPRYVNGFLNLGLAWFKLRDDQKALYYWKRAENLYPNNPYLMNYYAVYGNLLKERASTAFDQQRYADALKEYIRYGMIHPEDPEIYYLKAGVFYNLGQFEKARTNIEKAIELRPGYEEAQKLKDLILALPAKGHWEKGPEGKGENPGRGC